MTGDRWGTDRTVIGDSTTHARNNNNETCQKQQTHISNRADNIVKAMTVKAPGA